MKNIRDKIEDIFRSYPDVGVNRNKFLIDELEQLFFQENVKMLNNFRKKITQGTTKEIEKMVKKVKEVNESNGRYNACNEILEKLKQKLTK